MTGVGIWLAARLAPRLALVLALSLPALAQDSEGGASSSSPRGYADDVGSTGSITITRHINKARAAAASDPKSAKNHYVQAIELSPKSTDFMAEYYKLCMKTRDWPGVAYVLPKWFAVEPAREREYSGSYGLALVQTGKLDKAGAALKKALASGKEPANTHEGLLRLYLVQGNSDGAMREYRQTLRLKPNDADLHTEFAAMLWKQNKLNEAVEEYRAVARLKPGDAPSQAALGFALMQSRDYAGAYAAYRRAAELAPKVANYQSSMKQAFEYDQKYSKALKKKD